MKAASTSGIVTQAFIGVVLVEVSSPATCPDRRRGTWGKSVYSRSTAADGVADALVHKVRAGRGRASASRMNV